ncbi:MAG: Nif3-like dinuclear metal center hexameric protein [Streptococcaceae bacterium]|jgi:dinuclear metal center YbgI/SA1388 family protein|nr:Nif3-like dinuclear metal center hexameric protein [Streptococcaceae bacterium]
MKISEFVKFYEALCPKELAEAGDPVGLQIGSLANEVHKVLVTLDIREQTVEEAKKIGADLIIAKHPIIFRPLANLTDFDSQEKIVLDLVKAGISVYTSHTNIDIVSGGLNDFFAVKLGLTNVRNLLEDGMGRIGDIKEAEEVSLESFIERAKKVFQQEHFRIVTYNHDLTRPIRRVAICGGSGGKFWSEALAQGADLYITADIYYHVGHDICSSTLTVLDPGHYMEQLFIELVAEKLASFETGIEIIKSEANTNPFYDI